MNPELQRFFDAAEDLLLGADDAAAMQGRFPGWEVRKERLSIYPEFVAGHIEDIVDKLFPICRAVLPTQRWETLRAGYLKTRPAIHYELNGAGRPFPEFVEAQLAEDPSLPAFLAELAGFEWADFEVFASAAEHETPASGLGLNPTLIVRQHRWRICAFAAEARCEGDAPEEGAETALLWRHPERLRTRYFAADDSALLALKMAIEGIDVATAAAAGGVDEAVVRETVERWIRGGLICGTPL